MPTVAACGDYCDNCDDNGPGLCDQGRCIEPYKYFFSTKSCGVCAANCVDCNEPRQCDPDKCSPGYKYDTTTKNCTSCDAHCKKCSVSGEGLCDSGNCQTGYTIDPATGNTCTACGPGCMICNTKGPGKCDPGQCSRRYDLNADTDTCVACPADCEVCTYNPSQSRTECKQCYGPRGVSTSDTCKACAEFCHLCFLNGAGMCDPHQCFVGYTLGPAKTCVECPPDCAGCNFTNRTECTLCYGLFGITAEKTCAACAPNCDGCATKGAGKCDSNQCHTRFGFHEDSETCKPCPSHCSTCTYKNDAATCTKCDDHHGIKGDKTCGDCDSNCNRCFTNGAQKCDSGQCKEHYAFDGASMTCKRCNDSSDNCDDCYFEPFVCTSCSSPYEWNNTSHQCSGAMASLWHDGSWANVNTIIASVVVYVVSGLVI